MSRLADAAVENNMNTLTLFLKTSVILLFAGMAVKILKTYGAGKFSECCLYDLRVKTFKDISQLPAPYLDSHPSGDLISRVTSDLGLIQGFLQGTLGEIISTPVRVFISALFLFLINWKLSVFALICVPLLFFLTMKVNAPVQKYTKDQQEEMGKVNALAQDSISVKLYKSCLQLHCSLWPKGHD